jgi:multiple sugar transport system substrate-binding protein
VNRLKIALRFVSLVIVMALVFTACGSGTATGSTKSNSAEKVKLTFSWWGDKARHDATLAAIKVWNSKHPEIQVEGAYQGWDGYSAKLSTQFAAGVGPDIFQISSSDLPQFAKDGLLKDLTPYKSTDFAGIDESLWADLIFNNKIYAVSSGVSATAYAYNKTKAEKYNLDTLTADDTMDTLLAKCKKATIDTNGDGKLDLWGIFDPMDSDPSTYDSFVKPFGLSVWTPDFKGCQFTNPKIIAILKKYEQFRKMKVIVPPDVSLMDGQSYIGAGFVEYTNTTLSAFPGVVASTEDELGITLEPKPFEGGKDLRAATSGLPIAINNKTKNPDAAVKFLSWFLTDPDAAKAVGMVRGVFPSKAQRDATSSSLNSMEKSVVEVVNQLQALGHKSDDKIPDGYVQFLDIFTQEKNRYLLDQITLEQFMENIQTSGSPALVGN